MKKLILISIMALVFCMCLLIDQEPLYAADDYLITTGTKRDSTFTSRSDIHYRRIYVDTITFTLGMGDTTIDLEKQCGISEGYNFFIKSIVNAGGAGSNNDSTFAKFAFSAHRGIWHDDSVARNYDWAKVGENDATDALIAPIASDKIYVRMCKGDSGAADTFFVWELKFYY